MQTRTFEMNEPHDARAKQGVVQVVAWPVRIWFNTFEVTETFDEETEEWVETDRKFLRFFDVFITEEDADELCHAHFEFRVVDPEWIAREKEILKKGKQ